MVRYIDRCQIKPFMQEIWFVKNNKIQYETLI